MGERVVSGGLDWGIEWVIEWVMRRGVVGVVGL